MFERMQTPAFAEAARKLLNEPLRVRVPEHLRRPEEDQVNDEQREAQGEEYVGYARYRG